MELCVEGNQSREDFLEGAGKAFYRIAAGRRVMDEDWDLKT